MASMLFAALLDWEEWKATLTIEQGMPDMTLPVPGYIAYGALALGGLFLLVALWRLLTLRIFRFFFTLLAALIVSYYPIAYGLHWWLYKYNEAVKNEIGYTPTEQTIINYLKYIDWGILAGGFFFGIILFYLTLGGGDDKRRYRVDEEDDDDLPLHLQQQQQRQQRQRQARGAPQPKDPFDFS